MNASEEMTIEIKQCADADWIDVVQMRAFELDAFGAPSHRLVHDEIGRECADPAGREVRIDQQNAFNRAKDAHFHEQQREQDIEDEPDDAAGMRVRQAREKIRPCDRARIRIRDVDLESDTR